MPDTDTDDEEIVLREQVLLQKFEDGQLIEEIELDDGVVVRRWTREDA